jgi:hypothetical protein
MSLTFFSVKANVIVSTVTEAVICALTFARTLSTKVNNIFVRAELFTAVTKKNVVCWDIKPQFVLHRRHITSPLQITAG